MEKTYTAHTEIAINATPERVWEVLTTAENIKKYMFGTDVITSWIEEEPIEYYGEYEGKKYHDKGIVKKFVPEKTLQFTYLSSMSGKEDLPENYNLVTYSLSINEEKQVVVTLLQDNIHSEEEKEHSVQNWNTVLQKLKEVAES
ncbi:SRPBCC family protein [Flavobacterium sp. 3HN19-14]|uniref:SRPBCC family protein n=1 Tax=Flavobacterium sp. 3HN19-14 TaxID=3448133 RepID=UPI003EE04FD5